MEKLAGRHHDLIGRLAPAAAPTHAVCQYAQNAPVVAWVGQQDHLVLLVFPITLVDAGGGAEANRFGHSVDCGGVGACRAQGEGAVRVLSNAVWHFYHAAMPLGLSRRGFSPLLP